MKTPRELIKLAATIANDLDTMADYRADRITHISFGNDTDDDGTQRHLFTLGEGFQHPTPETQTAFATTATWLRNTLPALLAEHDGQPIDDDHDAYDTYYPEQVAEILGMKLTVDGPVTAYWRDAELAAVLAGRDSNVWATLAATFASLWQWYLLGDQAHITAELAVAQARAARHDVESIEDKLRILAQRDDIVRAAVAAGISKNRVFTLSGIARTTVDRVLADTSATMVNLTDAFTATSAAAISATAAVDQLHAAVRENT